MKNLCLPSLEKPDKFVMGKPSQNYGVSAVQLSHYLQPDISENTPALTPASK